MTFRQFITSKLFLKQLLLALAAAIVVLWVSLKLLDTYTLHGRTITVPDLEGFHEQDIKPILEKMNLTYSVNDSIFDDSRPKGSVAAQNPLPGTQVKKNRTIYLTMVAYLPEMIPMPNLNDLSLRQAVTVLGIYGLKVGYITNRPDIAKNAVLQQVYKNGVIEPGVMVEKGTAIDLVVGEGLGQNRVQVPILVGRMRDEAIISLHAANLNVGNEIYLDEVYDPENLRVYRQSPDALAKDHFLQAGSTVDIYYRADDLFDFEKYLEELQTQPLPSLLGKSPEEVLETLDDLKLELGEEVYENNVPWDKARVYRQSPEYDEEARVPLGGRIDVWYREAE